MLGGRRVALKVAKFKLPLFTGVPKYLCLAQDKPTPQLNSGGQGKSNSDSGGQGNSPPIPSAIKSATDNLLRALNTTKERQPSTLAGGKQVSLLNSIQKLLSSYSSGVDSVSSQSGDSSKPSSVASTRRSSVSEQAKGEGQSGKGSSQAQVSEATKEESKVKMVERSNKEGKEDGKEEGSKKEKDKLNTSVGDLRDKPVKPKVSVDLYTCMCMYMYVYMYCSVYSTSGKLIGCQDCRCR